MACIRSGQEVSVLVYSGEQVWIGSIFSNMACYYGIMIEVNPKFCKCGSVFNIYYLCIHDSNCTFSSTWTHDTWYAVWKWLCSHRTLVWAIDQMYNFLQYIPSGHFWPCVLTWFLILILEWSFNLFLKFYLVSIFIHNDGFLTTNKKENVDFFSHLQHKLSESEVRKSRRRWSYRT